MTDICIYFQVHQPYRLNKYSLFQIGNHDNYFDDLKNKQIMHKVARKCYLPTNKVMRDLIAKHDDFKIAYSITGTAIQQFEEYEPRVLDSFQELADTGAVEFLAETSHHSLSALYSNEEFTYQVKAHKKLIKQHFNAKPKIFRNTELIYNNDIAKSVEGMGFKGILAEGWDSVLTWRSPNYIYKPTSTKKLRLLMKNYRLSDDIAFRFSNQNWQGWPLTAEKYADWVAPILGDTVNLFMDYETFGEHQWADTGIFNFLKQLPTALKRHNISFHHPSELLKHEPKDDIDAPHLISWADVERDVSAWLGNHMQQNAAEHLYQMRDAILATKDNALIESWRRMTTSDHLYYMCTKWFNDGDVHKYFNAYDSPYDAFIAFMNVLQDMALRLKEQKPGLLASLSQYIKEVKT